MKRPRQFKVKPWTGEPSKPRSKAQEKAARIGFRLANLRGLWTLASRLSPNRRKVVQMIIDDEIVSLGFESQTARIARLDAEADAEFHNLLSPGTDQEIPF